MTTARAGRVFRVAALVCGVYCLFGAAAPSDIRRGAMAGAVGGSEGAGRDGAPQRSVHTGVLPPLAAPLDAERLYQAGGFELTAIEFEGAVVLRDELQALAVQYVGRRITSADLNQLRHEANLLLSNAGYINSGVLIPDQSVQSGRVYLEVVSGRLASTSIRTDGRLRSNWLDARLAMDGPFNVAELRDALQMLERDPRIERLDARVEPGNTRGEAHLSVDVHEVRGLQVNVLADNARSPSVGAERGAISISHDNVSGFGDTLYAGGSFTSGLADVQAGYSMPFGRNWTARAFFARSDSTVVEAPFDDVDIESRTTGGGLQLERSLLRTLRNDVQAQVSLETRENQTRLMGLGFSFSPGARNGESRASVVRMGTSWSHRRTDQVLSGRLAVTRGLDLFDSSIGSAADSRFTAMLAQVQYAGRFRHFDVHARALTQLTPNSLLSVERLALGGQNSVRGYRENQLVRDNGGMLSAELRRTVFASAAGSLTVATFVDWGRAWNHSERARSIESVGLGVLGQWRGFDGALWWGHGFSNFNASEYDWQDDGFHFRFSLRHTFRGAG